MNVKDSTKKFLGKSLVMLLLIAIAVPGLNAYLTKDDVNVIAKVGGAEISLNDYQRAYEEEVMYIQNVLKINLSPQHLEALGLRQAVLNKLIERKLVDSLIGEMGLKVGKKSVLHAIRKMKVFQEEGGGFKQDRFLEFLRASGVSQVEYYKLVESDILRNMVVSGLMKLELETDDLASKLYEYIFQKRNIDIVNFTPGSIKGMPTPSKEDLIKVYNENKVHFFTPENRSVEYAVLNKSMNIDDIVVTDEDVEEELAQMGVSEKFGAMLVVFSSAEKAEEALEGIIKGGNKFSDAPGVYEMDGEFDTFSNVLESKFAAMSIGDVSGVVQLGDKYYLFQLLQKRFEGDLRGDSISKVKSLLYSKKVNDHLYKMVQNAEDDLANGLSLSEVAKSYDMGYYVTGPFSRDGIPDNLKRISGSIFDKEVDSVGGFIEFEDEFLCFTIKDVVKPELQPFESVADEVKVMWFKRSAMEQLHNAALQFVKDFEHNKKAISGVRFYRDSVVRSRVAGYDHPKQSHPNNFVESVFTLNIDEATIPFEHDENSVVVGILRSIEKPERNLLRVSEINRSIKDTLVDAMHNDLKHYLSKRFKIVMRIDSSQGE